MCVYWKEREGGREGEREREREKRERERERERERGGGGCALVCLPSGLRV